MNEAIKLAIEKGGYIGKGFLALHAEDLSSIQILRPPVLDPLFWQALGRASGWGSEKVLIDEPGHPREWLYDVHCSVCGEIIVDQEDGCPEGCETDNAYIKSWLYFAHQYFDLVLTGGDTEAFWKQLLV